MKLRALLLAAVCAASVAAQQGQPPGVELWERRFSEGLGLPFIREDGSVERPRPPAVTPAPAQPSHPATSQSTAQAAQAPASSGPTPRVVSEPVPAPATEQASGAPKPEPSPAPSRSGGKSHHLKAPRNRPSPQPSTPLVAGTHAWGRVVSDGELEPGETDGPVEVVDDPIGDR